MFPGMVDEHFFTALVSTGGSSLTMVNSSEVDPLDLKFEWLSLFCAFVVDVQQIIFVDARVLLRAVCFGHWTAAGEVPTTAGTLGWTPAGGDSTDLTQGRLRALHEI